MKPREGHPNFEGRSRRNSWRKKDDPLRREKRLKKEEREKSLALQVNIIKGWKNGAEVAKKKNSMQKGQKKSKFEERGS